MTSAKSEIDHASIKEIIEYDPDTGFIYWKKRMGNSQIGTIAGYKNKEGYIIIGIYKKYYKAHRLAWLYMKGYFPQNMDIDHKDKNGSNNKWDNLRIVSHVCNMRNSKTQKSNTSGVSGVNFYKKIKKWVARIVVFGDRKYLGSFTLKADAVKARWNAEKKYKFPNCNTTSTAFLYLNGEISNGK